MRKNVTWKNSKVGVETGEALDKVLASGAKMETIAHHLNVGLTTLWRWKRKESFPQRRYAKTLLELAENISALQVVPPQSRVTELFNEWVSLESSARKKLLAAMNAYDALQS